MNSPARKDAAADADEREDFEKHFNDAPWWARMLFIGVFRLVDLVQAVLKPWPIVALVAITMLSILVHEGTLPSEKRSGTEIFLEAGKLGVSTVASSLFAFGGWILLLLVIAFGGIFAYIQHKRILKQGEENSRLRELLDPDRISSRERD